MRVQIHSAGVSRDGSSWDVLLQSWEGECVVYRTGLHEYKARACADLVNSLEDPWLVDGLVQEGVQ